MQGNDLGVKYMLLAIPLKSKPSSDALQGEGDVDVCQLKGRCISFCCGG